MHTNLIKSCLYSKYLGSVILYRLFCFRLILLSHLYVDIIYPSGDIYHDISILDVLESSKFEILRIKLSLEGPTVEVVIKHSIIILLGIICLEIHRRPVKRGDCSSGDILSIVARFPSSAVFNISWGWYSREETNGKWEQRSIFYIIISFIRNIVLFIVHWMSGLYGLNYNSVLLVFVSRRIYYEWDVGVYLRMGRARGIYHDI